MAKRDIPPEDLARAGELLEGGASFRAAARETNISTDTLKRRFPGSGHSASRSAPGEASSGEHAGARRRRDPKPKPRARPRAAGKVGPSDEQLEKMLRKVAIAPSVPMKMWVHCDYCTMHFVTQGPEVARQLVVLSGEYPELREMLEALWGSWEKYMWAGLLVGWLGVPVMHHLAPAGIYNALAPLAAMPPRGDTPAPAPVHAHPASNGAEPATAAPAADPADLLAGSPLAGMDVDEILSMAEQMGMEVPAEILAALGKLPADEPEPSPPDPAPEPELGESEPVTAAAEAASAASDQDADEH